MSVNKIQSSKKNNEREAIKTIHRNINRIYIDSILKTVLDDTAIRLKIDDDLYDNTYRDCKDEMDTINDIHELIKFLTKKWIEQCHKDELLLKTSIRHWAKEEANRELKNVKHRENDIEYITNSTMDRKDNGYISRQIETYIQTDLFLQLPVRVNFKIWKSVVDAKLFNVPIEKVFECTRSILKDYLPTILEIQNGFMLISINELTKKTDIAIIWDEVKRRQQEYKNKYKYEQSGRKCKDAKLDRLLLELQDQGLKPKAISEKLYQDRKIKLSPDEVSGMLKEIRKRARTKKNNELLKRYS
jgi:hypothetical protein